MGSGTVVEWWKTNGNGEQKAETEHKKKGRVDECSKTAIFSYIHMLTDRCQEKICLTCHKLHLFHFASFCFDSAVIDLNSWIPAPSSNNSSS